jgi:uncharacterized protein DUF4232
MDSSWRPEAGQTCVILPPVKTLILSALAAAIVAAPAAGHAGAGPCKGSQLSGRFAVIPGSAGAGNIVYRLTLKNTSPSSCTLTGLPQGTLLGKTGRALPTHVTPAFRGGLTAVLVHLAPGGHAYAKARFSPDVNGVGDNQRMPCQPVAYWFRVVGQNGSSTTKAPILPPTSVCERGSLSFTAYSSAK